MWHVYLIKNLVNGKLYIGKTGNLEKRWAEHLAVVKGGREKFPQNYAYLHSAIAQYGKENFSKTIFSTHQTEADSLNDETYQIARLKSEGFILYNLTNGGDGISGYSHTEDAKRRIAAAKVGNKNPLGTKRSEETKRKIGLSKLGKKRKPFTDEAKNNMSLARKGSLNHRYGKHVSEETKTKISLGNCGENSGRTNLTWDDVNQIRYLRSIGTSLKILSIKFGVGVSCIGSICRNERWKV